MPQSREERVKKVYAGGRHVVILGAGASIAATRRDAEIGGKKLPSMNDFVDVLELQDILDRIPEHLKATNFENLYSNLYQDNPESEEIKEIEKRVYDYFQGMKLPDKPTIYDYLVLSLRGKDMIATFNWDPFLYQAYDRNSHVGEMPKLVFLHGNVAIGYSEEDKRSGPAGMCAKETGSFYPATRLLYPIGEKNYNSDEFISRQWEGLKTWLHDKSTKRVTIFGYGAPASDVEAVKLLKEAWGTAAARNMEQFEIIDVRDEEEVREQWDEFIHSHHYDYATNYFKSSLARNPRRTCEAYGDQFEFFTIDEAFSEANPVPELNTLEELWAWHKELVDAENEAEAEWKRKKEKEDLV